MNTINKQIHRPVHIDLSVDPVIYEKARRLVVSHGENMSSNYRRYLKTLVEGHDIIIEECPSCSDSIKIKNKNTVEEGVQTHQNPNQ